TSAISPSASRVVSSTARSECFSLSPQHQTAGGLPTGGAQRQNVDHRAAKKNGRAASEYL
ncbi:MAG: hypothetical protein ACREPW_13355, partial [Candidatus Binataceae bacterium]